MLFRGFPHNPHLSAHIFFTPLRLTFTPQNTIDVPLDNVVLLDLLFQPAIVGVERFFLFLELYILRLRRGDIGELAADQRGLDRFCGGFKQYDTALMGSAVCCLVLCSAVCVIHGLCLLICCDMLDLHRHIRKPPFDAL